MTHVPVEPAPSSASFVEDFIDIFYTPSSVFERRRGASPWPALLVITGLFAILSYVNFKLLGPAIDAEIASNIRKIVEANPQMTAEAAAGTAGFIRMTMLAGAVVLVPLGTLILGLVLWLVAKLFEAQAALSAAFFIATMSWMPRVLESVLSALQGLFLDPTAMTSMAAVSLSPARFVDVATTSPVLVLLLQRLNPFVIWSYIIIAIGIAVMGRIPRSKGALTSLILWILATVPALLGVLRQPGS